MKYQLVIFDWDGTLMDSTGRIVDCMQAAARQLGLDVLAPVQVQQIIGLGLPEAISTLYPRLSDSGVLAMRDAYAQHFIAAEQSPSPLFAGAEVLLQQLRSQGMRLAVATGKSRKGLDRVWRGSGLGQHFDYSRCADESGSKPHPQMLKDILAHLCVAPQQALMVGDTSFDLEMAQRAGIDRIGVTYGAHDVEVLAQFAPLALVDALQDILPLINEPEREWG